MRKQNVVVLVCTFIRSYVGCSVNFWGLNAVPLSLLYLALFAAVISTLSSFTIPTFEISKLLTWARDGIRFRK